MREFRFDDFTFDCASRLLLRREVPQHLSPKALQLLQLLLQSRPRALSREELYDKLWPATFVCETNLAGVVNELRRALGDDARAAQYIRTVHGFGYAFCGQVSSSGSGAVPLIPVAILLAEGRSQQLYEGDNAVGRSLDGRVVLNNSSVSRRHAIVRVVDGEIWIEDLNSKNGTYIDGEKITSATLVTRESRIAFGGVTATIVRRKSGSTGSLRLRAPHPS
jgi:DNA-binding winged helix-turn-helix (wHTH) protein